MDVYVYVDIITIVILDYEGTVPLIAVTDTVTTVCRIETKEPVCDRSLDQLGFIRSGCYSE